MKNWSFPLASRKAMSVSVKLFAICFLLPLLLSAQSKRELEMKKAKLQQEIIEANKQLNLLSKSKTVSIKQIDAIKKKISARQELISTINSEINSLDKEIGKTSGEIHSLSDEMSELKKSYARLIQAAQLNQNRYQRLMYLFSSADFNQAFSRLKYLQQINEYRRKQAAKIDSTQLLLAQKKSSLEIQKQEKTGLRNSELENKRKLDNEKKEQDRMLARLQDRESKLRKEIAEKERAKKKLENAIAALVRKEIEAAKKKAIAKGKKNVTNANVFTLTPEAQKLSSSFAANKGSLPWPVEKGIISEYFGEHPHPTLKGVIIKNDGIDILSSPGSSARSIFRGEVSGTIELPGSGSAVIIRHGEYLTVYSNLESIAVKKGDAVATKQTIGTIGAASDESRAQMNLQIWKGFNKLNPQQWIARN